MTEHKTDSDSERVRALNIPAGSPAPRLRLMEYGRDELIEKEIENVEDLQPYARTTQTTWIDIQGLGDEAKLLAIARIFDIHDVALDDAVNVPQRAKAQAYPDYLLIVLRAPDEPFDPSVPPPQVCLLLTESYVISFQERYFGFFDSVRERIRNERSILRGESPAMLTAVLVDTIVDRFFPIGEQIAERLDEIEQEILDRPSPKLVSELYGLQRQITTLRRVARPQVEAIHKLAIADSAVVQESTRVYLRDAEDHARQSLGRLDSAREIATDTMSAVLATLGHQQNEVMKVLTIVGSIFIPLTFIAGIYGMNFENMPELGSRYGYPVALSVMALVAGGMITLFRRNGWLGRKNR